MPSAVILSPTSNVERINSVDIIRGVSLLGILLMNIIGFGLYKAYYDPTNSGGATGWNLKAWWINAMFFEGTMRGMFSLLFGAGIILFTSRSAKTDQAPSVTDLFFRRLLWLFLFGIIHAYLLIWYGDILYPYAIVGMFAYSFRNWSPKNLIIGATLLCLIATSLYIKDYVQTKSIAENAALANLKLKEGKALSKQEKNAVKDWESEQAFKKASPEGFSNESEALNKSFHLVVMHRAPRVQTMQTTVLYRIFFWDVFAMMLLGMAFLKNGILKAAKSNRYYIILGIIGYAIGLTTNYFETDYIISQQFSILSFYITDISHELGRVFTTIGHIALIMLFIKSGFMMFLQRSLAAVGQMAFTNYIMQTIICNIFFIGFGMFGKLERHELYYIVLVIWIFQLIASPIWLMYFRFGPLEWGWRSLTYWQIQPFKKIKLEQDIVLTPG